MPRTALPLLAATAALMACSSASLPSTAPVPDEYFEDCSQISGRDTATSLENYVEFFNAETAGLVKQDSCKSPSLVSPAAGSTLSASTPPTFTFKEQHQTCARPSPSRLRWGACDPRREPWWMRGLDLLESRAQACDTGTGFNYLVRLTHEGDAKPVWLAMVSVGMYTPNAEKWKAALTGRTGQTLKLIIQGATLKTGAISDGPYVQPLPYTFPVGQ